MRMRAMVFVVLIVLIWLSSPLYSEVYSGLTGKVVDEETGKGVKGVRVYIYQKGIHDSRLKTDVNGEFRFMQIPPGIYTISFYPPPPYALDDEDNMYENITIEPGKISTFFKEVRQGGTLEIMVYDRANSAPISGVDVYIKGASLAIRRTIDDSLTDKDGKFKKDQLPPMKFDLVLQKDGWGMKIIPDVEIFSKQVTSLEIDFDSVSSANLKGYIKCKDTLKGINEVLVIVFRLDKYGWAHTYTCADGSYSMLNIEPGLYSISIIGFKTINDIREKFEISKNVTIIQNQLTTINFTVDCSNEIEYKKREKNK